MISINPYLEQAISHYKSLDLLHVESLLEDWLDISWSKSPYRDVLIPTLIGRKLELNEDEYGT